MHVGVRVNVYVNWRRPCFNGIEEGQVSVRVQKRRRHRHNRGIRYTRCVVPLLGICLAFYHCAWSSIYIGTSSGGRTRRARSTTRGPQVPSSRYNCRGLQARRRISLGSTTRTGLRTVIAVPYTHGEPLSCYTLFKNIQWVFVHPREAKAMLRDQPIKNPRDEATSI